MIYYPSSKTKILRVLELIPILLLLLCAPNHGMAQNTVSPYSVFGPGEIQDRGFSVSDGMGGAGIALKSGNYLNNLNPASYVGMDSLRIISEFGLAAKAYNMRTDNESQRGFTGNLSYLGLGFRYTSWMAGSFGVVPFSTINYNITKKGYVEGTDSPYYSTYTGSGGISQFYFGNAIKLGKHLSLGVNVSYMFGSLIQDENITGSLVPQLQVNRNDHLRSFYFDYGIQYSFKTTKKEFSLGATFAPAQELKSKHILTVYNDSYSIVYSDEYNTDYLAIPNIAGLGFAVVAPGRYKVALDYNFQNWSDVTYPTQNDNFVDFHKVAFGAEVHPWTYSVVNSFYKNWTYRLGVNYTRSYLQFSGSPISKRSLTLGVGIPLPGHISNVNFSVTGGWNGSKSNNLVEERFLLINLGFNLNEMAFIHRKID